MKDASTEYEPGLAMKIDILKTDIPFRQNWSFTPRAPHVSVHRTVLLYLRSKFFWGITLQNPFKITFRVLEGPENALYIRVITESFHW